MPYMGWWFKKLDERMGIELDKRKEIKQPCYICQATTHTGDEHYADIMYRRQMERTSAGGGGR